MGLEPQLWPLPALRPCTTAPASNEGSSVLFAVAFLDGSPRTKETELTGQTEVKEWEHDTKEV